MGQANRVNVFINQSTQWTKVKGNMKKTFKELDFIDKWMVIMITTIVMIFVIFTTVTSLKIMTPKAHAESLETAEITVCDTRCEATEYVLWKYLEGYDGETAPILQIPHDGAWWAEFNETIYYLTDLREKGEI